jgi:[acyl-carrier-protein] S-malonyltransferase
MPATMIAFTFPGQGSQKPAMGSPWADHPSWELVEEASVAADRDVAHLLLHADADELKQTRNSQLATLVSSLVVLDAVERLGLEPAAYAGHSLGEYTSLVASGAISFEDGVRLVVERGEAMQSAGDDRPGTMAAVLGLDDDKVEQACTETAGDVWVANYNAPGQVVIAGDPDALASAGVVAKGLGAKKVLPIPVSGAFHTPFMAAAQDRLTKAISTIEFRSPDFPVIANVDAQAHANASDWTELLSAQLCNPVRWRQSLYTLDEMGVTTFVELGAGSVLSGMTKRTINGATSVSVSTPDELDKVLDLVLGSVVEPTGTHEGEHLFATERVVVSPSAGVFDPDPSLSAGLPLVPGQVLGRVGEEEVRSAFTGSIVGVLAEPGERVTISQPIAWLRTA